MAGFGFGMAMESQDLRRVRDTFDAGRFRQVATTFRNRWLDSSAEAYRKALRDTILQGEPSWPPLAMMTVLLKGHNRPLQDTEQLMNSFQTFRLDPDTREVGVHEGMGRTDTDLSMAEVAIRDEFGFTDEVTGTRVPARPFNQPTFDRMMPKLFDQAKKDWLDILREV